MTEAPALPFTRRVAQRPSGPSEAHPTTTRSTLAETRRAGNRSRNDLVAERRCECTRPSCQATFPAAAEAFRGLPGRFIIAPEHFSGHTVVSAADRFFVVDPSVRSGSAS
jgi:hypothetical protein